MTRISKRKLSDEALLKIYNLFFEIVHRSRNREHFLEILGDILSPTEKIMIAKRVAILFLLLKEIEQRTIARVLKVSTATTSKFANLFFNKDSKTMQILRQLISQEKTMDFLEDIFMSIFNQPGIKIGHWKMYWDYERKKERKKATGF